MFTAKTSSGRKPPDLARADEFRKHVQLMDEERVRQHADLVRRLPGDKTDRITFKSAGDGVEVRIPNTLGFRPVFYEIIRKKGRYTVWDERESFADDSFLYLFTDAPENTPFTVRFYD